MEEVKKTNWWKRKTPGQKASFIVGAVLFVLSLAGFILLMNGRELFGQEFGDKFFCECKANGWVALTINIMSCLISIIKQCQDIIYSIIYAWNK